MQCPTHDDQVKMSLNDAAHFRCGSLTYIVGPFSIELKLAQLTKDKMFFTDLDFKYGPPMIYIMIISSFQ